MSKKPGTADEVVARVDAEIAAMVLQQKEGSSKPERAGASGDAVSQATKNTERLSEFTDWSGCELPRYELLDEALKKVSTGLEQIKNIEQQSGSEFGEIAREWGTVTYRIGKAVSTMRTGTTVSVIGKSVTLTKSTKDIAVRKKEAAKNLLGEVQKEGDKLVKYLQDALKEREEGYKKFISE